MVDIILIVLLLVDIVLKAVVLSLLKDTKQIIREEVKEVVYSPTFITEIAEAYRKSVEAVNKEKGGR
jgi:hypothetical protein